MTISLETACERILGNQAAQAIIGDMGLRWAVAAATAKALKTDDAEAIAEIRRYPHAMQQPELDRHDTARHSRAMKPRVESEGGALAKTSENLP